MVIIDEIDDEDMFCPAVCWAQLKETISLKVNVTDAKNPKVDITENALTFQVKGNGARGYHTYKFTLEFFKPVDSKGCIYKVTPAYIDIQITKKGPGEWWPRLLPENVKKPHFLKLDFERWKSETDDEEENTEINPELEQLKRALREDGNNRNDLEFSKTFYLFLYNAIQCLLFITVTLSCLFGVIFRQKAYIARTYRTIGGMMWFGVCLSYLETIHALFGVVKAPWKTAFVQSTGRIVALFCIWLGGVQVRRNFLVWALFVTWSLSENIRYPFYLLQVIKREIPALTWLRYHAWLLLYPIGAYCENRIINQAASSIEADDSYFVNLPGTSIGFHLHFLLRFYSVLLIIGVGILMRHLWKMRSYKFGKRKKYKSS